MKQSIFSFLILVLTGIIFSTSLSSCRKDKFQPTIKQYDSIQIRNYITDNGLTGFLKDTTGGDTTGMYYKILVPGSGKLLQYSDEITFVFTERTFDGTYTQADTINNHFYDYVGHIQLDKLPLGLQTAVHNLLKYPNASMRVLIPSHLAYGISGTGSGSSQVANNRIAGNECLDFYIHAVNNFPVYDDQVIQNYLKANSLTGYTRTLSTLRTINGVLLPDSVQNYYYYKILISASTEDPITSNTTITATYTGQLFNATIFDGSHNGTNTITDPVTAFIPGVDEVLTNHAVAGTEISFLLPSTLAYGVASQSGIPAFSCLRFTWDIVSITP